MSDTELEFQTLDWEKDVPSNIKEILLGTFMKKPGDPGGNQIGGLFREKLLKLYHNADNFYPVYDFISAYRVDVKSFVFQPRCEGERVPYSLVFDEEGEYLLFFGENTENVLRIDMRIYRNPVSEHQEVSIYERYYVKPTKITVLTPDNEKGYIFPENFCDIPLHDGSLTEEDFVMPVLLDMLAPLSETSAQAPVVFMDMSKMEIGGEAGEIAECAYPIRVPNGEIVNQFVELFVGNAGAREEEVPLAAVPDSVWTPFFRIFMKSPEEDYGGGEETGGLFRETLIRVNTIGATNLAPVFLCKAERLIDSEQVQFFFSPAAGENNGNDQDSYWVKMYNGEAAVLVFHTKDSGSIVIRIKIEKTEYSAEEMSAMYSHLMLKMFPSEEEDPEALPVNVSASACTVYHTELTGIRIVKSNKIYADIEGDQWEDERKNFGNIEFTYEAVLDYFTERESISETKRFVETDREFIEINGEQEYDDTYSYDRRKVNAKVIRKTIDKYSHRDFNVDKKKEDDETKPWNKNPEFSYIKDTYPSELRKYAYRINRRSANFKIGSEVLRNIVSELAMVLSAKESSNYFNEQTAEVTETMPNLAFLGEPGTGKSSTAQAVAEGLLGAVTHTITGSSLQGQYVGQTKPTVIQTFKTLQEKALNQAVAIVRRNMGDAYDLNNEACVRAIWKVYCQLPKILIVDEAYVLLNQGGDSGGSSYGAEAVETLLEAMAPGRKVLYCEGMDESDPVTVLLATGKEESDPPILWRGNTQPGRKRGLLEVITEQTPKSVTLDNTVAVWLLGYEKEMRRGLSANKGLYRRVKTITLDIPSLNEIKNCFMDSIRQKMDSVPAEVREGSLAVIKRSDDKIHDYFRWGKSKTYAEFFGNYAGAKSFAEEIIKTVKYKKAAITASDISRIIDKLKHEIRNQYKTVISLKTDRAPFMVYTDIEEKLKDYIGGRTAKEKLAGIVDMMVNKNDYVGCDRPKGAILGGPPGTGKTYLAKCMAGELISRFKKKDTNLAFISVAATELRSPELISMLFAECDGYDNAIIFIDEIDAIGRKRETLQDPSMLIQLMAELDGFDGRNNVFVLGATNAPESLDNALVRPGRFDMMLEVDNPDRPTRVELIRLYTKKNNFTKETVEEIADLFAGNSPIEIKTLLNEAKILYADCEKRLRKLTKDAEIESWFAHRILRDTENADEFKIIEIKDARVAIARKSEQVDEKLFLKDLRETLALRSVGERKLKDNVSEGFSVDKNDESLASTAIHEVGHALMNVLLGKKFEKITILSRGNALGYVEHDINDKPITKKDLIDRIDTALGGRAAEEIIYGKENISGGALSDIRQASNIARYMIMELGMNENIGPVALTMTRRGYLGSNQVNLTSEAILDEAEAEVRRLIKDRYSETLQRLLRYSEAIKDIAREVYEAEEMTGDSFKELCGKYGIITS